MIDQFLFEQFMSRSPKIMRKYYQLSNTHSIHKFLKENLQIIFRHTVKNHNIQDDILFSKLNSKLWKNQICNCKRLTLIFIYERKYYIYLPISIYFIWKYDKILAKCLAYKWKFSDWKLINKKLILNFIVIPYSHNYGVDKDLFIIIFIKKYSFIDEKKHF